MILSSRAFNNAKGFAAIPWWTTSLRNCQIHSNVRANWQEAWKEIFFETLEGAMHTGGSTTNLTMSISKVIGIRSGLKP